MDYGFVMLDIAPQSYHGNSAPPQRPAIAHSQDVQQKAKTLEWTWHHGWPTLALLKLKVSLHQKVPEKVVRHDISLPR